MTMKNLILIITMFSFVVSFGQQKKSNKATQKVINTKKVPMPPPRITEKPLKIIKVIPKIEPKSDQVNCFLYVNESSTDTLVSITENLLEYGWNNDLARMVISNFNYDPKIKKKLEKEGKTLNYTKTSQFINGSFSLEKGILTFIPDKDEANKINMVNENKIFRIILKPKSKNINYLKDENGNKYSKGECLEPIIGAG